MAQSPYDIPDDDPEYQALLKQYGVGGAATEQKQNSAPYEIGRQLIGGLAVDAPKMINAAGEWFSPKGSGAEQVFRDNKEYWAEGEEAWAPQLEGRGAVSSTLIKGARALGPSGVALAGAVAAPWVATPAVAALFGGSQAQDTYDRGIERGLSPDDARSAGWKTGAAEGLLEAGSNFVGGKVAKGAYDGVSTLFGAARAGGLGGALAKVRDPAWVKPFAKDWALGAGVETGTEFAQGATTTAIENAYNISNESPLEQGAEGAQAALGMSLLLGPFAAYGHRNAAQHRKAIDEVLKNPEAPLEQRMQVGKMLHDEVVVPEIGKDSAAQWLQALNESMIQDRDVGAIRAQEEQHEAYATEQRDLLNATPVSKTDQRLGMAPGANVSWGGVGIAPPVADSLDDKTPVNLLGVPKEQYARPKTDSLGMPLDAYSVPSAEPIIANPTPVANEPIVGALGNAIPAPATPKAEKPVVVPQQSAPKVAKEPKPIKPAGKGALAFENELNKALAENPDDEVLKTTAATWNAGKKTNTIAKELKQNLNVAGPNVTNETPEAALEADALASGMVKRIVYGKDADGNPTERVEWIKPTGKKAAKGARTTDKEQVAPEDVEDPTIAEGIRMFQAGDSLRTIAANLGGSHTNWGTVLAQHGHVVADRDAAAAQEALETETAAATTETPEDLTASAETPDAAPADYTNTDEFVDNEAENVGVTTRSRMDAGGQTSATTDAAALGEMKRAWDNANAGMKARITSQLKDLGVSVASLAPPARAAYLEIVQKEGRALTADDVAAVSKVEAALKPNAKESKLAVARQQQKDAISLADDSEALEKGVESLLSGDVAVAADMLELLGGKNGVRLMQWLRSHFGMPASVNTPKAAVEYFVGKQADAKATALTKAEQMADLWGAGFDKLTDDQKIDFAKTADGMGDLINTPSLLRQIKEEINGTDQARQSTPESTGGTESNPAEAQRPDTGGAGEGGTNQSRTPEVKVRKKRTIEKPGVAPGSFDKVQAIAPVVNVSAAHPKATQANVADLNLFLRSIGYSGGVAPLSTNHLGAVAGALVDVESVLGAPWLARVRGFGILTNVADTDAVAVKERGVILFSPALIAEATAGDKQALAVLREVLVHESTHLWDRQANDMDSVVALNPDFASGGAIRSEMEALYAAGNAPILEYPLGPLYAHHTDDFISQELLAQAAVLYAYDRAMLKQEAPLTYKLIKEMADATGRHPNDKRGIGGNHIAVLKAIRPSTGRQSTVDQIRASASRRGSKSSQGSTGNRRAGGDVAAYGRAQAGTGKAQRAGNGLTNAIEKQFGSSGVQVWENAATLAQRAFRQFMSLHDVVAEYGGILPSAKAWHDSVLAAISTRKKLEADAESIAARAGKLKRERLKVLNDFVSRSTYEQKWGYDATFDKADGTNRKVVADPEMAKAFKSLRPDEQQIAKDIFAHGEKMKQEKYAILKELELEGEFNKAGALDGPYAPLKRFGDFIGVAKSKELVAAETAEDKKKIEELKADPDHYLVSYFDTKGQAAQFARESAKAGWHFTQDFAKSVKVNEGRPMKPETLNKVLSAIKAEKLPPGTLNTVTEAVKELYFSALDEHNARTSGLKRKNRAGYDADMVRSFLSHAQAEAGFLANMKHGGVTNDLFYKLQNESATSKDRAKAQEVFNTLASHYAANLDQKATPIQDRVMALTSIQQLATNPAYHIQNLMQPGMVTVPRLAADFGDYAGAWRHLLNGYKVAGLTGVRNIDLSKVKNPNLRAMLTAAEQAGLLDVGMDEDLNQFTRTRSGFEALDNASGGLQKLVHKLRQISRMVEATNRISAGTAAYNMALEKNYSPEKAAEYAISVLRDTQGDFSRTDAPLILKKLPKVVGQYRKFQLMMAAHYVKAFRDAFLSDDANTKAVGRRALAYSLGHAFMAAGALGLPTMNIVAMIFAATGDDDEPKDLERWMREALGNDTAADMLTHGPLMFAGLDAKLAQDKVFAFLPYSDWDLTSKKGVTNLVTGAMGPSMSNAAKMADGLGLMGKGEYHKGLEKLLPSGLSNSMKAYRVANEGYTLPNGDVMVKSEDIAGFPMLMDAIGLKGPDMRKMDWMRSQQYEVKQFYTDRTKEIQHDYAQAAKDGDKDAMMEAREDWMALQDGKENLRLYFNGSRDELKRQPLSNLLKYPQTQAQRERKLQKSFDADS